MRISKYIPFIIVFVFGCLPLFDLLHPGLPVTHDGQDHVARIANFYQSLQEGVFIPRWAANLNWGYGHPVLMFLYPFSSYLASLFHFVGFAFVDSVKLVFAVSFILSGLTMYIWVKEVWGRDAGIISALLYMYAPYRFVDLYVRGAIGEHAAFIFLPLVMYCIYKLFKDQNRIYSMWGSVFLSGFILAHNAISLMFMPIIGGYFLYLWLNTKDKKNFAFNFILLFLLGFGLAAFFWVPAFFEGKYTLRDIVTKGEYASRFVDFKSFLYGDWSYGGTGQFTTQLGVGHWLAFGLSIFILLKNKSKNSVIMLSLILMLIVSLFLMTSESLLIWKTITILQKFQFPWRILSISVFCTSVLGGIIAAELKKYRTVFLIVMLLITLISTKDYWHAKAYMQKPESFYTGIYDGTTDTGESAPIWSVRFMEKRPKTYAEVIQGTAQIKTAQRNSVDHGYLIETSSQNSRIRENTIYFPGWHVYVDSNEVPIEFQDQNSRGLITFSVNSGKHVVEVIFKETKLRLISDYISLISFVVVVLYSILGARIWQKYQLF